MTEKKITVQVSLYDPLRDEQPKLQTYDIPYTEGMRVLDALHYIHDNYNGSLAYRWECRAGQCGSCAVMINGKAGLACRTLITPESQWLTITPLPIFPVVKDLVVDLDRGVNRLLKVRPYLERASETQRPEIIQAYEIEDIKPLKECIECWSCMVMCPVVTAAWEKYAGPMIMGNLARLVLDKRDCFDHLMVSFLDGLNACTQCGNCKEVCPKDIDIPEKAVGKMRYLAYTKRNLLKEGHRNIIESLKRNGNPLMELPETRGDWAKDLDVPIAKNGSKILYFAGCMASWREQVVGRATATLLKIAGANFTTLGPYEKDCGSVLFRINDLELAKSFALNLKEQVKKYGFDTIVSACAGCFRTFSIDYVQRLGIELGVTVMHSSQLFAEYIDQGKIQPRCDLGIDATYHDPCHLGRHVGVFQEPRKVAKSIGIKIKEMLDDRYAENARCCGAGGGVRSGYKDVARDVATYRLNVDTPKDINAIVHTCPFCFFNFEDAVKIGKFPYTNIDLTEALLVSTVGENASKIIGQNRYNLIAGLRRQ